ncbi:MAG: hypothetical protein AB7U83_20790 [Vicinamibacterales bacterium]
MTPPHAPGDDQGPAPAAIVHPPEDAWVRFASRDLDPAERASMADHIVACAECARVYRAVAEVSGSGAGLGAGDRTATSSRWRERVALAASVALAVAGWTWLIPAAPSAPSAVAPAAGPVAPPPSPSRAEPPAWAALGEPPALRLPASLTLAVRGSRDDADAFMAALGTAMTPYRAGRFAEAATALAAVAAAHPAVPEGWFYLGAARLHAGMPAEAIEPLRRAAASAVVGDDASWWEAVALARAGRDDDAQRALQALCAAAGPNRARACAAVDAVRPAPSAPATP